MADKLTPEEQRLLEFINKTMVDFKIDEKLALLYALQKGKKDGEQLVKLLAIVRKLHEDNDRHHGDEHFFTVRLVNEFIKATKPFLEASK